MQRAPDSTAQANIEITIKDSKGLPVIGLLTEAGEDSLLLRFPIRSAPMLSMGHRTSVHFLHGKTSVQLIGKILHQRATPEAIYYQVQVTCDHISDLQAMVFRRNAFRVKPDSDAPIQVLIASDNSKRPHLATLNDISRTGLSIMISMATEALLFRQDTLSLQFQFPGETQPFQCRGLVRYRQICDTSVRYGMAMDLSANRDPQGAEEHLMRYVNSRQVHVIQVLKRLAEI